MENDNVWKQESDYSSCSDYSYPSSVASSDASYGTNDQPTRESEVERREKNKRNSRVYNEKKKTRETDLEKLVAAKSNQVVEETRKNQELEGFINEVYFYIKNAFDTPPPDFINEHTYEQRQYAIQAEYNRKRDEDSKFAKLKADYSRKLKKFEDAAGDLPLKEKNTNTYGSRKSRALHSMRIAKHQFEVAKIEYKLRKLKAWGSLLNEIHDQFTVFVRMVNTNPFKYNPMNATGQQRVEELVRYFVDIYNSRFFSTVECTVQSTPFH